MKTLVKVMLCVLTMLLSFSIEAQAQSFNRKGNTFEQVASKKSSATPATKTAYTWKDSKGIDYPIYITQAGRCYVNKVSTKTGKGYKYYLEEDLSKTVCKEMGITYQPKKTKSEAKKI